jgi:hypothetical protein
MTLPRSAPERLLARVSITLLLSACTGGNVNIRPTALLGGVMSGITPDEARRAFSAEDRWQILDEWSRSGSDGRPAVRILRVWIEPYTDLGVEGALMLSFLNNELASATFFPKDPDEYFLALRRERGLKLAQESVLHPQPGTTVRRGVNATKHTYVVWEDTAAAEVMRRASS